MRISELARTAAVPLATVKFYLREGLLPPGRPTAATQAEYDATHLRRLRLVRALTEVGGLSLAAVRDVLAAVDEGPGAGATAVARAHDALPPVVPRTAPPAQARAVVAALGWLVDEDASAVHHLQAALAALAAVGRPVDEAVLQVYARAALAVAAAEVAGLPAAGPDDGPDGAVEAVEAVVIGTVLHEPLLLALRRLAQQHVYRGGAPAPEMPQAGP